MAKKKPSKTKTPSPAKPAAADSPASPVGPAGSQGTGSGRERRHPGLEEAWRSSEPGPRPLVMFLAAGALLLLTAVVAGFTWGAHSLGIPVFLALPVLVGLLLGGFLLLQRSVKD